MTLPSAPPLAQVHATLSHAAPRVATLSHVADLASCFLDTSHAVSPARAAASGSLRLFQRVAVRLFHSSVDPIYRAYSLAKAIEAAIEADDLAMVQEIHSVHPRPLDARSLKFAMAFGPFELVQWVIANRHDLVCCESGVKNLCRGCVEWAVMSIGGKETFRIASWLIDEGVLSIGDGMELMDIPVSTSPDISAQAALLKSAELVRCVNAASAEIVQCLLERGYVPESEDDFVDALVAASCHRNQETLVQYVLASKVFSHLRAHFVYAPTDSSGAKVLQWDHEYDSKRTFGMSMTTSIAGEIGHLATMKWVEDEHDVDRLQAPQNGVTEEELLKIIQWLHSTGGDYGAQT